LITILAGGTGSVKLVRGLAALTKDMVVISNVGDNIWLHGLYICPDIDTIVYGLAGLLDEKRGWGVKDDSFECLAQLEELGAQTWFSLGDKDLATHLARTAMMNKGKSLSKVTEWMRRRYAISARIIPATDNEVATKIITDKGKMHLQEFWVKYKGNPAVTGVQYDGAKSAKANRKAIEAIRKSDVVIVAPANPVSSIGPIVALTELRKELAKNRDKVVAVSPLIGGAALSGPAVKYMKSLGLASSPAGVAEYYKDFVGSFVIAASDHGLASKIQSLGMKVYETNITMKNRQDEIRLGQYLMDRAIDN
jgi:LPPG:FO 2-phospho-L-lactate transferase